MFDISQPSEPRTIHVTMSGGGTRAALASGGANLALLEAKLRGDIAVASMTAVSGSAMLARLLIADGRSATTVAEIESWVDDGVGSRLSRRAKQLAKAAAIWLLRGIARAAAGQ